jgi:hypothetical protein
MMEWYVVEVTIDGEIFNDAIQGDSALNAYENALDNWEYADKIRILGVE